MGRVFDALHRTGEDARLVDSPWDLLLAPPQTSASDPRGSSSDSPARPDEEPALAFKLSPEYRLFALPSEHSVAAENIRILAGRLIQWQQHLVFKRLLISSSTKGEGKSVISANVAIALAATENKRVVLIDGDIRQATLSRMFNVEADHGVTDCLESGSSASQFLRRMPNMSLWFLPVGRATDTPLRADGLDRLLSELNDRFDWLIIDSPPVTLLADAAAWSVVADRCVLVARRGVTPKKLFSKAVESIDPQKLLGTIVNDCTDQRQTHYTRYYQRSATGQDTKAAR